MKNYIAADFEDALEAKDKQLKELDEQILLSDKRIRQLEDLIRAAGLEVPAPTRP